MNFLGNVLSIPIILSMDALKDRDPPHNMSYSLILNFGCWVIVLFCAFLFNGRLKRFQLEQARLL